MTYTTPITDRTITDIRTKTAKAYFNVADWQRIYDNVIEVDALALSILSITVPFSALTPPTVASIPTAAQINTFCQNIEDLRAEFDAIVTGLVTVKTDWEAGAGKTSPDYQDVNNWENNIKLIYDYLQTLQYRKPVTGVAITGAGLTQNNYFRSY